MAERKCSSWEALDEDLARFFKLSFAERQQYVFRGHADSAWALESTLDRFCQRHPKFRQADVLKTLTEQFQRECGRIAADLPKHEEVGAWPLLARHHGVPSPILDWTRSPYIALFFACADSRHEQSTAPEHFAIYCFSLNALDSASESASEKIEVIDDSTLIRFNPRAVVQQSVFLKVSPKWASGVQKGLFRWLLPSSQRFHFLERLESMGITHTSLLGSMDAAAQTAIWRATELEKSIQK